MNSENDNYGGLRPNGKNVENYGGEISANNSYSGAPGMASEEQLTDSDSADSEFVDPEKLKKEQASGNKSLDANVPKSENLKRPPGQLGNL